jgi:cytochrome P450
LPTDNHLQGLSALAPRPPHVPESRVHDFDMFADPEYLAEPHTRILRLLREAPDIFWTPRNEGHWILLRHAPVFAASRDTELFSSQVIPPSQFPALIAALPAGLTYLPNPVPINRDPPEHTKYRAPLSKVFGPKTILALEEKIRLLADKLIDAIVPKGECDFIPEVAELLPVQVFLEMLGLPLSRQGEFRALVQRFLTTPPKDGLMAQLAVMRTVADAMDEFIKARRAQPGDDLISLLWASEIDGQPVTHEDMLNYGCLLFIAGLDTVVNGIGFGIRHLAGDPALQAKLRAQPSLIARATEEFLRRYTFTIPARRVAHDAEFQGVQFREHDPVTLFLPGADLDEREFPEPEKYDLEREPKPHLAFNGGPHRCLGSHLARLEMQVMYQQMLARLPEFRLDPQRPPRFHCGNIIGIDTLTIQWNSAP